MADPLAPAPMSALEIADLVARVQIACDSTDRVPHCRRRDRSENAAHWAHANRETCAEAGRHFDRGPEAVRQAWHRLYPSEPVYRHKRRRS